MGNKLVRRRQVVDEKYTRPQGLYQHKDVDYKKLRKLILDSKLAPCYPGDDECSNELEGCPICFLYYPSLNRSRCCIKGICTECFLQMKTPNSTRPTQCPYCKTSNYAVEYRGGKTKEEKGIEQIEEQRVIEAKIRIRQQELEDEEVRTRKRQEELASSSRTVAHGEVGNEPVAASSFVSELETEDVISFNEPCPSMRHPRQRQNRDDEFDLDLEDIMVMEAIWLSIQENGRQINSPATATTATATSSSSSEQYVSEDGCCYSESSIGVVVAPARVESTCSPSGGLACAIAALAERQQTSSSSTNNYQMMSDQQIPGNNIHGQWNAQILGNNNNDAQILGNNNNDEGFQLVPSNNNEEEFQMTVPIVPESFEEQMMMAMAVSLAEAQTRTTPTTANVQGLAQQ